MPLLLFFFHPFVNIFCFTFNVHPDNILENVLSVFHSLIYRISARPPAPISLSFFKFHFVSPFRMCYLLYPYNNIIMIILNGYKVPSCERNDTKKREPKPSLYMRLCFATLQAVDYLVKAFQCSLDITRQALTFQRLVLLFCQFVFVFIDHF